MALLSYPIPAVANGDDQVRPVHLPSGMDNVQATFTEAVQLPGTSVRLAGVHDLPQGETSREYTLSVTPTSGTATLYTATVTDPVTTIRGDQLWFILSAATAIDVAGNLLDGEWVNPTGYGDNSGNDTYATGGNTIEGGNFNFKITVFIGDTDDDGDVDLTDLNNVRNNFGCTGGCLGDTDWDGDVDLSDQNNVRDNFGASGYNTWPSETPPDPPEGPMGPSGGEQLSADESDEGVIRARLALVDDLFEKLGEENITIARGDAFWTAEGTQEWWDTFWAALGW